MECTQDLHYQQQLEQQELEQPTMENLDTIAYQCLGAAQALRDLRGCGNTSPLLTIEARLIDLVTKYEKLKAQL